MVAQRGLALLAFGEGAGKGLHLETFFDFNEMAKLPRENTVAWRGYLELVFSDRYNVPPPMALMLPNITLALDRSLVER